MPELLLAGTLSWEYHVLFTFRSHEWSRIQDDSVLSTRTIVFQHRAYPEMTLTGQETPSTVVWQLNTDSVDQIIEHLEVVHVLHNELQFPEESAATERP